MMGKNRITLQTLYDIFDQQNNPYHEPYRNSYKWSDYTSKDYREKLRRLQLSKKPISIIYGHRVKKYKRTENDVNRQAIQDEDTIEEIRRMAETEPEPVIYRISKPMENLLKLFNAIGKFSDQPIKFDDSKGKTKKKIQIRKVRKKRKEDVIPSSPSLLKTEPTRIWAGKKEHSVKILPRRKRPEYDVGEHRRKEERKKKLLERKKGAKKTIIPPKKARLPKSPPKESFFITELTETEKLRKKGLLDREKEIEHHVKKLNRLLDKRETIKSHVDLLRFPQEEIRRSNLRIEKAKKGSLREYQPKRIILDFNDLFPVLSIQRAKRKKDKQREKRRIKEEKERKEEEKKDLIRKSNLIEVESGMSENGEMIVPSPLDNTPAPIFDKEKSKAMFERELKFHNKELEMQRSRKKFILLQGKLREFNETVKECSDTIREITEDGSFFDRHLLIHPVTSLRGLKEGDAMSTTTDSLSTRRTGRGSYTTRTARYNHRNMTGRGGVGGHRGGAYSFKAGKVGSGVGGSPVKTFNWKQDFVETQIRKQMELLQKLRERELDRQVVSKSIDALSNIAERAEKNGLNWVACRMNYRTTKKIRKKIRKKVKKKKKKKKANSTVGGVGNRILTGLSSTSQSEEMADGSEEEYEEGEIIMKVPQNIWKFARESLDKSFYALEDCVIFYDNLKVYCDQNYLPRTETEESFLFSIREELIERKRLTKNLYYRVLSMTYRILADGGDSFEMAQFVRKELGIGPKEFFKFVKEKGWKELSEDFISLREKWEK